MHDELAQKVEVHFGCDFLVNAFIDVIILIRRFVLATLEVLVKLVTVLEQQMEDLLCGVHYFADETVAIGHCTHWESLFSYEHALQNVNHFDLELRVRNLLVNGHINIEDVALVFRVLNLVELGGQNPQQDHEQRTPRYIRFYVVFFVVLLRRH